MNPNTWNWWEIPLGIATGGMSAINHAIIQGGYNLVKQPITNLGNQIGQVASNMSDSDIDRQEAFNAEQAQLQRDWEERMANTAIQRQVADLKAAGLNPYLALGSGMSGAVTPSGASASSNSAFAGVYGKTSSMRIFTQALTTLASSAMQVIGSLAKAAMAA